MVVGKKIVKIKKVKTVLPRHIPDVKIYTQSFDWRRLMSNILGTQSKYAKSDIRDDDPESGPAVHWYSKVPGESKWWDSCALWIQVNWDAKPDSIDTYCSLYSLYHELEYAIQKRNPRDSLEPLLVLPVEDEDNWSKILSHRRKNKAILKRGLARLVEFKFPLLRIWLDWSEADMKADWLAALDNL